MTFPVRVACHGRIDDGEIRLKISQFGVAWPDEHIFHKMRLPCHLHDKAHF